MIISRGKMERVIINRDKSYILSQDRLFPGNCVDIWENGR